VKVAHLPCHLLQFFVAHASPRGRTTIASSRRTATRQSMWRVRGTTCPNCARKCGGERRRSKTARRRLTNLRSAGGG
jgi:hypothetical protein